MSRLRNCAGVATLEFTLAALLVLCPLVMAIFELAQLAVARHGLGYAATEVARTLDADVASDELTLRSTAALALTPLFPRFDMSDAADGGYSRDAAALGPPTPYRRAVAEALRPDVFSLQLTDVSDPEFGHRFASTRVRLRWCRETFFPIVGQWLSRSIALATDEPFAIGCLLRARVPLEVEAVSVTARFPIEPTS